jgi:hypothetical protein
MFPGKGIHLVLNEEYRNFVARALEDIDQCYSDDMHDEDPQQVIMALTSGDEDLALGKWGYEKDNFGVKAIARTPYKNGELRVTVVLTNKGELKLDIREWYENS